MNGLVTTVGVVAAAATLTACDAGSPAQNAMAVAAAEPDPVSTNVIAAKDAEIAKLKAEIADLKNTPAPAPAKPSPESATLCYKDYCPCDPPQGGPDQILCDQLEAGIEPGIQLMIAGRGMREARRQMATGDY